jgi:cytochrome c oxidase subunit 2
VDPSPSGRPSTADATDPEQPPTGPARARRTRWLGVLALIGGGLLLAGCQVPTFGIHPAVSRQGNDSVRLWQGFFISGSIVFILVFVLISWAAIRYRRRSDKIPRQTQYHLVWEIVYTAIPIAIVLVLFGFTFVTENAVDALPTPQMSVTVTGFQWGWRFHYTTQHVTVIGVELQRPEMVLPENETIRVNLKSHDVIHGFYVPALEFSRYLQPGVTNKFTLNLTKTGTFRGQCTQFCGLYHSLMRFRLKVVTPAQFRSWVTAHRSSGAASIATAQKGAATGGSSSSASTPYTGSTGT